MSITGNNNVLLGAGATLPSLAGNYQFVAGSPQSTAYLAYSGSSAATASGVVAAPTSFTIGGRTALNVGGTVGTATDALYSAGAGAPVWAPAPTAGTAVRFGTSQTPALANLYTATNAGLTLTLPTPVSGTKSIVKNMSTGGLTVAGPIVPVSASATVATITIGTGGAAGLVSDSTTWYQIW